MINDRAITLDESEFCRKNLNAKHVLYSARANPFEMCMRTVSVYRYSANDGYYFL